MKRVFFVILLFIAFCISCKAKGKNDKSANDQIRNVLSQLRSEFSENSEKDQVNRFLYNVILALRFDLVQEAISKGADPNYCRGEFGWQDSNPLNMVR
jgi:hypothetical protein